MEIEVDGDVMGIEPLDAKPNSLSFQKEVTGSSNLKAHWSNHQWVDVKSITNGDWSGSFWHPANDDTNPWLEIDLGDTQKVQKAVIYEWRQNIKSFELQYKKDNQWITFYEGTTIGERAEITFPETEIKQFRMVLNRFDEIPGIYEIVLL